MSNKLYIGHETQHSSDILRNGFKISSQLTTVGQGSKNRRVTNNAALLLNYRKGTKVLYDQVDGIYFRVFKNLESIVPSYGGNAIVLLKPSCLETKKWHFNTTENFGFYLNKISPFSGESGKTLFSLHDIKKEKFDETSAELIVLENLSKDCICKVLYF
jgi:hypothetical protein